MLFLLIYLDKNHPAASERLRREKRGGKLLSEIETDATQRNRKNSGIFLWPSSRCGPSAYAPVGIRLPSLLHATHFVLRALLAG